MRSLKGCPDSSASTAWDYTGLLCNLYRDSHPKHFHHSQTCRVQSPLNPFYTWCNMLLTGSAQCQHCQHSLVVSTGSAVLTQSAVGQQCPRSQHSPQIPPYSPFTSPPFFPPLRARELEAIIIIIVQSIAVARDASAGPTGVSVANDTYTFTTNKSEVIFNCTPQGF